MNIFDISISHTIFDIVDVKQLFSFLTWHSNLTQCPVFYLTALIRNLHPQEIKAREAFATEVRNHWKSLYNRTSMFWLDL